MRKTDLTDRDTIPEGCRLKTTFITLTTVTLRDTVRVCASVCQTVGHEVMLATARCNCNTVRGKREAMKYDVLGATPAVPAASFTNEWVVCLFPLYSKMPHIGQRCVQFSDDLKKKKPSFWWDAAALTNNR